MIDDELKIYLFLLCVSEDKLWYFLKRMVYLEVINF